ncbi:hypothetical protein AWB64_02034 [Caballeronia sordidicola]|uniref:Uncharacterized protein n=1 Tax=Caballeronia sordidicola TaxID=196367 RepID=A0A158G0B9_CABSO|nr:hypothetical protein [Caballeronia sordidicola]SAL25301.1 hypothetical protein AWB64_02034 [Caballeronia sordidicola]
MSSRPTSLRSIFIAASLLALGGLAHAGPGTAAASIDPGIYSGAPFAFRSDRAILSAVPDRTDDARIFSPVSNMGDIHPRQPDSDRVRLRHDL